MEWGVGGGGGGGGGGVGVGGMTQSSQFCILWRS
jgi:hypothetical protein